MFHTKNQTKVQRKLLSSFTLKKILFQNARNTLVDLDMHTPLHRTKPRKKSIHIKYYIPFGPATNNAKYRMKITI